MTVTQDVPTLPPTVQVYGMYTSVVVTQIFRVAIDHRLFTRLLDGARTSAELATATGTHESSLHRLLRAMCGLGLLRSGTQGWALTPLGSAASEFEPGFAWAEATVSELGRAVETGRAGMSFSHGCTAFEYLAELPDEGAHFDHGMTLVNAGEPQAVADAYDFAGVQRVVDVGGGTGTLLVEVLRRRPELHGVLFDLPRTVESPIPEVDALRARIEVIAGDFFDVVPSGADAYVLSHVVHDWPEPQALAILARVREAIPASGRLLIVEMVMPADDTPHPAHMLDISMLLLTGGEERTEDEYAELLARAGFRLGRVIPTRSSVSVLEAVPC